jgi:hypothetical protein
MTALADKPTLGKHAATGSNGSLFAGRNFIT